MEPDSIREKGPREGAYAVKVGEDSYISLYLELPVLIYFYSYFQLHRAEESMGLGSEKGGGGEQADVSKRAQGPRLEKEGRPARCLLD